MTSGACASSAATFAAPTARDTCSMLAARRREPQGPGRLLAAAKGRVRGGAAAVCRRRARASVLGCENGSALPFITDNADTRDRLRFRAGIDVTYNVTRGACEFGAPQSEMVVGTHASGVHMKRIGCGGLGTASSVPGGLFAPPPQAQARGRPLLAARSSWCCPPLETRRQCACRPRRRSSRRRTRRLRSSS